MAQVRSVTSTSDLPGTDCGPIIASIYYLDTIKTKIKDNVLLLRCALICAGLAWAFWHFLGQHGLGVLMMIALLGLALDNYRLRRRLRRADCSR